MRSKHRWIDSWRSLDNGENWQYVDVAVADVGVGNPPSLIQLADGRLCLTYGDRQAPYEIRAQLGSDDNGASWDKPIVLRTGGGGRRHGISADVATPRR